MIPKRFSAYACSAALSYVAAMHVSPVRFQVTKPVVQSTLEPSAGSTSSAGAAPGAAINTFQIGQRREAPPPGLLPQACLSHGLALVMP